VCPDAVFRRSLPDNTGETAAVEGEGNLQVVGVNTRAELEKRGFRPVAGKPLRVRPAGPEWFRGWALVPSREYTPPVGTRTLPGTGGRITVPGAFQP